MIAIQEISYNAKQQDQQPLVALFLPSMWCYGLASSNHIHATSGPCSLCTYPVGWYNEEDIFIISWTNLNSFLGTWFLYFANLLIARSHWQHLLACHPTVIGPQFLLHGLQLYLWEPPRKLSCAPVTEQTFWMQLLPNILPQGNAFPLPLMFLLLEYPNYYQCMVPLGPQSFGFLYHTTYCIPLSLSGLEWSLVLHRWGKYTFP